MSSVSRYAGPLYWTRRGLSAFGAALLCLSGASCLYVPVPGLTQGTPVLREALEEAQGKPFLEALALVGPPSELRVDEDSGRVYLVYSRRRDFGLLLVGGGYSAGYAWGEGDQRVCYLLAFDVEHRLASVEVETDTTHIDTPKRCEAVLWPKGDAPPRRESLAPAEIGAELLPKQKVLDAFGEPDFVLDGSLGYTRDWDTIRIYFDDDSLIEEIQIH